MSQSYGPPDAEEAVQTIRRALDLGVTLIDTARLRQGRPAGWSARALAGRRGDAVVATKFGIVPGASRAGDQRRRAARARAWLLRGKLGAARHRRHRPVLPSPASIPPPPVPTRRTVGAMPSRREARSASWACRSGTGTPPAHATHRLRRFQSGALASWIARPSRDCAAERRLWPSSGSDQRHKAQVRARGEPAGSGPRSCPALKRRNRVRGVGAAEVLGSRFGQPRKRTLPSRTSSGPSRRPFLRSVRGSTR